MQSSLLRLIGGICETGNCLTKNMTIPGRCQHAPYVAEPGVLPAVDLATKCRTHQPQQCAQPLEAFAGFVNGDRLILAFGKVAAGTGNLIAGHPAEASGGTLICPEAKCHLCLSGYLPANIGQSSSYWMRCKDIHRRGLFSLYYPPPTPAIPERGPPGLHA